MAIYCRDELGFVPGEVGCSVLDHAGASRPTLLSHHVLLQLVNCSDSMPLTHSPFVHIPSTSPPRPSLTNLKPLQQPNLPPLKPPRPLRQQPPTPLQRRPQLPKQCPRKPHLLDSGLLDIPRPQRPPLFFLIKNFHSARGVLPMRRGNRGREEQVGGEDPEEEGGDIISFSVSVSVSVRSSGRFILSSSSFWGISVGMDEEFSDAGVFDEEEQSGGDPFLRGVGGGGGGEGWFCGGGRVVGGDTDAPFPEAEAGGGGVGEA